MGRYHMINSQGKDCGVQTVTDTMADRLEAGGWELVPVQSEITAQVVTGTR